jgi:hypothetical protein
MSLSNKGSKGVLDYLMGKSGIFDTQPTNLYVALSTTDPGDAGTGETEPGDTYARYETSGADWTAATDANVSEISNATALTFPQATAAWGDLTHFALFTAITGGTCIASSALTDSPKSPTNGDTPRFNIGELKVTLT